MNCCICNEHDPILEPIQCKTKQHKICKSCWFAPGGFAEEMSNHKCPGCIKNNNFLLYEEETKT